MIGRLEKYALDATYCTSLALHEIDSRYVRIRKGIEAAVKPFRAGLCNAGMSLAQAGSLLRVLHCAADS